MNVKNEEEQTAKKSLWEEITEDHMAFLTACIVMANLVFVYYNRRANERLEKLFIGQNKPLIDVTPIGISQENKTHSKTSFSVVNYSGFPAYNIAVDFRYGKSKAWISEWLKARNEKDKKGEKKGVVIGHFYPSTPEIRIPKLESGETAVLIPKLESGKTEVNDFEGLPPFVIGALDLEEEVCSKGKDGHTIWVRVTWQNEKKHIFDEIHQYKLIGTKDTDDCPDSGTGRAFTFIPEGIISHKNMR